MISFRASPTSKFGQVIRNYARCVGKCEDQLRFSFDGRRMHPEETIEQCGIEDGDEVMVMLEQRGRKPVIYLFPPTLLSTATVSVRLVPQWDFSHVYPPAKSTTMDNGMKSISWNVSAEPDGTLTEKGSNLELSYLFWEAVSDSHAPDTPPLTPVHEGHVERFHPAFPSLEPDMPTAVLLSSSDLLPYLDSALRSLSLHTSARNDFITYWLPSLSKQPYTALRFLPQAVYERAAELEVEPKPDVVTRVFMLFRGVPSDELEMWQSTRERSATIDWPRVVGVTEDAWDSSLFRVLEWGAMEVNV
ncbi:hypothetical protein C8Q76DRAFT_748005 [Earliella scabrosa]|nr:hypothetical protein C8Q76DRAFT_748005 [Earliella scabrosa]